MDAFRGTARTLMNMTRENKLALVVGFGLILFVGILISDHFSTARNQEAADIRSGRLVDPLVQTRHENPTLIELPSARPPSDRAASGARAGPLAMNPSQIGASPTESRSEPRDEARTPDVQRVPPRNEIPRIVMGGRNGAGDDPAAEIASAADELATANDSAPSGYIFHEVQRGESLIAIARRYYGDESRVKDIAEFNNIDNPNSIRVGHRLRLPAFAEGEHSTTAPQRPAEPRQVYTTYTVKRGDTLSEISQQMLGTSKRWRELYDMNKNAIRDPDNLLVGAELKIPRPGR